MIHKKTPLSYITWTKELYLLLLLVIPLHCAECVKTSHHKRSFASDC